MDVTEIAFYDGGDFVGFVFFLTNTICYGSLRRLPYFFFFFAIFWSGS